MNTQTPLTTLRAQGLDADLFKCRLRIWPRSKMSKEICEFVTENLPVIVDALIHEANAKCGNNHFLWELPEPQQTEMGGFEVDMRDKIPLYLNGQYFFSNV